MTIYNRNVPIIALDGNHRSGKGTQLELLQGTLQDNGYQPIILRGDGSRPGSGVTEGDPESAWWQQFKEYSRSFDDEYTLWRLGSLRLLAEAALLLETMPDKGVILFDRAGISRAQMTLRENLPVTLDTMYRGARESGLSEEVVHMLQPDITVFLSAPTEVLLDRLDPHDPKYAFRKSNIIVANEYFEAGYTAYKQLGVSAVSRIGVDDSVTAIAEQINDVTIGQL